MIALAVNFNIRELYKEIADSLRGFREEKGDKTRSIITRGDNGKEMRIDFILAGSGRSATDSVTMHYEGRSCTIQSIEEFRRQMQACMPEKLI